MARTMYRPANATKKRTRADSTATTAPKKTRRAAAVPDVETETGERDVKELVGSDAVTLRNQQESPLLRLPAELREHIWTLAFGTRTVHPVSSRGYLFKGVGKMTYYGCLEEFSDQEIYNLTLQGAADDNPFRWKADEIYQGQSPYHRADGRSVPSFRGVHSCDFNISDRCPVVQLGVPTACKLLYYEAMPLMWETTTFCFSSNPDFQDFVKTSPSHAARVQQLTLCPRGERNGWDAVLTPQAVGSFTSLLGLHLILAETLLNLNEHKFNVLKNPPSHIRHLTNLVTQFQGLKLERERTTVWITGLFNHHAIPCGLPMLLANWKPRFTVEERREVAEHVREKLLEFRPRRRTGRGRG